MDIRLLIEALRGGNAQDPNGVVSARRYPNGEVIQRPYGRGPAPSGRSVRSMMPTGLRKLQLHNQEVQAGIAKPDEEY